MTERRSVAILFMGIFIIAAASLGPSLMGDLMAEPQGTPDPGDETLDEYAETPGVDGHPPQAEREPARARVENAHRAAAVLEAVMVDPDTAIPTSVLSHARAVVVIPGHVDANSPASPVAAKGLMAGRSATGEWSAPIHVFASGAQAGPPFEGDLILVFDRDREVASLLEGPLPLGDGTPVAPGPLGRGATIGSSDDPVAVHAWSRSGEETTGTSLESVLLGIDRTANSAAYGTDFDASAALDGELETPSEMVVFRDALARSAPRLGS